MMDDPNKQLQDLIRVDPEAWFTTFAVIKDKRGRTISPEQNTLQKKKLMS